MIDHPLQRRIKECNLNKRDYMIARKAELISLELEYKIYKERNDTESCKEIHREYKEIAIELLQFTKALKYIREYHKARSGE